MAYCLEVATELAPAKRPRLNPRAKTYCTEAACCLDDFKRIVSQETENLRFASDISKKIPIYNCAALEAQVADSEVRNDLQAEWARVFLHGPGLLVLKGAFKDHAVLDAASAVFNEIIQHEKQLGGGGDHFAKAGANSRIWNSLEKMCVRSPEVFATYHSNPWLCYVSEAWLGPMYQVSEQVNIIHPGGKAQNPHRDYHLGFQTANNVAKFPLHVQTMVAPMLTLQGAVAHVDVPIEAGPTKLLPFSQQYEWGYLAWNRDDFKQFFEDTYVQLPLRKGDMLFFNPALFHAGGDNVSSNIHRTVNLLQVSSPFGRCMESIDRVRMSKALYPVLLNKRADAVLSEKDDFEESCAIAACAEGYQFPSNLDRDVPQGSAAPQSQAELLKKSLQEGLSSEAFCTLIEKWVWMHASN